MWPGEEVFDGAQQCHNPGKLINYSPSSFKLITENDFQKEIQIKLISRDSREQVEHECRAAALSAAAQNRMTFFEPYSGVVCGPSAVSQSRCPSHPLHGALHQFSFMKFFIRIYSTDLSRSIGCDNP